MTNLKFGLADLEAAVSRILPDAAPARVLDEMPTGRNHRSWLLSSAAGPVVAKVLVGRADTAAYALRIQEHRRVAKSGVPVPTLLAFSPSTVEIDGRSLTVLSYLDGTDAEQGLRHVGDEAAHAVMFDAGRALAQLHLVPVDDFDAGGGERADAWTTVVAKRMSRLRRTYEPNDAETSDLVNGAFNLLDRLADDLGDRVRPSVVHLDVYLPNILLDREGRFSALIDLEHLSRADAAMDFVKPAMWMFAERPGWGAPFHAGYDSVAGSNPAWEERLSVATAVELLTGIEYWARAGDDSLHADYLDKLRSWVRSDGEQHAGSWFN